MRVGEGRGAKMRGEMEEGGGVVGWRRESGNGGKKGCHCFGERERGK